MSTSTRLLCINEPCLNLAKYCNNYVSTTKYNIISFFPVCLFMQFLRFANIYFLLTAVLQSLPAVSPLQPYSAIAPLCFVLLISLIREGVEDFYRYRNDMKLNNRSVEVLRSFQFTRVPFKSIRVGDVVCVASDEPFPCDLVLLSSPLENGKAYSETSNLDGDKNLKVKEAISEINAQLQSKDSAVAFGFLECNPPDPNLHHFEGKVEWHSRWHVLTTKQLLWAGASLRNTPWILGVAVYTGNDTKLRQSGSIKHMKQSSIEMLVNRYMFIVVGFEIVLCSIAGGLLARWQGKNRANHTYLPPADEDANYQGFLNIWTYFLLLNTMLPISLIVTLEIVKVLQAYFMMRDSRMYSEVRERFCQVSSSSLNEELGMIQHIFTDKTGTLTMNKMMFKACVIGDILYGSEAEIHTHGTRQNSLGDTRETIRVFNDKELRNHLFFNGHEIRLTYDVKDGKERITEQIRSQKEMVTHWIRCLTLCHECIAENTNDGDDKIIYMSQSPDEIALVDLARSYEWVYYGSRGNDVIVKVNNVAGPTVEKKFQRMEVLEFNSDRKRNSVIVRDPDSGTIYLYLKGADNKVSARLAPGQLFQTKIYSSVQDFSKEGLRTLVQAFKVVPEAEYQVWAQKYNEAKLSTSADKAKVIEALQEEMESDLFLLGCTAVEDMLQENVPQTVAALQLAGINVWMLTGDKLETAENIGFTTRLLTQNMTIFRFPSSEVSHLSDNLTKQLRETYGKTTPYALIIEDEVFVFLFKTMREKRGDGVLESFIQLSTDPNCKSVICCRVSPGQKKDIVNLIKTKTKCISLAVGDGANDVAMIKEAHVGVGIYGEEGMQAVQSSDYALGEFQYLWELVLMHGKWCYLRQSDMILYFFYKNLVFTMPQFFYTFYCAYSGQTAYDDWYITFYNMIFTAVPLIVRALFDRDLVPPKRENSGFSDLDQMESMSRTQYAALLSSGVDPEHAKQWLIRALYPRTYELGQKGKIFTVKNYIRSIMKGVLHSIIIFFIPMAVFSESHALGKNGQSVDFWAVSITSFTCIILTVNLKLALIVREWNWYVIVGILGCSVSVFFAFVFIYDSLASTSSIRYTLVTLMATSGFWLCIILCLGLILLLEGTQLFFGIAAKLPASVLSDFQEGRAQCSAFGDRLNREADNGSGEVAES